MNFKRDLVDNKIVKIELVGYLSDQSIMISPPEGNFSKSRIGNVNFDGVYFTINSVELAESGKDTIAGFQYVQSFSFNFPNNKVKTKFIRRFKALRTIRVWYCGDRYTDLGRNDYHQNKPMVAQFNNSQDFLNISYEVQTIFPYEIQEQ